jgi:hypothetical protein
MKRIALVALIFAFSAIPAKADMTTVNVDFQPPNGWRGAATYSGLGMAPDTGTYWNEMNLGSRSNLLASDGVTVTDVDVSTNYTYYYADSGNALLRDRIIWSGGTPHAGNPDVPAINISGLVAGAPYDIYMYAGVWPQVFTVNGESKSLTATGYGQNYPNWVEGTQYVSFLGVIAEDGAINIEIYNTAPTDTVVSGMQIQLVPVPGAVLLGMLGLSVVGVKLRKHA